ncbi:MAG TPA: hypothetical protein DCZ94_20115 [Lentisphaeria bacterium]|nr:MAG: hypothetical protein A2X48_14760 [Lentisphaerae bacterium GWF2_49_21]HBC89252.1 hypothetical protein [Lentisphaeria bacterium]
MKMLTILMVAVLLSAFVYAQDKPAKTTIEVPAEFKGVSIGPIKKGQRITLKYLKGEISEDVSRFPKSNPDDKKSSRDVGIILAENVDGARGLIQALPRGTGKHAFMYKFEKDYGDVVLMIAEDLTKPKNYANNAGSAEFEMTLTPAPDK